MTDPCGFSSVFFDGPSVGCGREGWFRAQFVNATIAEYGGKSANELVTLSHAHAAWRIADERRAEGSSVPMPYELFFEDAGEEAKKVLAVAEAEQKDRDFANALRAAGREAERRRGLMPSRAER